MSPKCEGCTHHCEHYLNEDAECLGRITPEEQEALNNFLLKKFEKPVVKPVEVPKTKIEQGFTWD